MSKLLIVSEYVNEDYKEYTDGYLGVDRDCIFFPIELYDTDHSLYKMYERYEKMTEMDVFINDLTFAKALKKIYDDTYPTELRSIIEVVDLNKVETYGKDFLGFDITNGGDYSAILRVLLFDVYNIRKKFKIKSSFYDERDALSKEYHKCLNKNQLFNSKEDALIFLDKLRGIGLKYDEVRYNFFNVVKVFVVN